LLLEGCSDVGRLLHTSVPIISLARRKFVGCLCSVAKMRSLLLSL
jgi:hypothetical protein